MPHQTFEQHLDGLVTIGVSIQWPYFYHKWLWALEKFYFLFIFLWAASMIETAYACHQNTLAIPSLFSNKLGGLQKRTTRAENCYESNLYLGRLQRDWKIGTVLLLGVCGVLGNLPAFSLAVTPPGTFVGEGFRETMAIPTQREIQDDGVNSLWDLDRSNKLDIN